MNNISENPLAIISLIAWAATWCLGGFWIARAAFRLHPREQIIIGVTVGLITENLLANWLGRILPVEVAAWISAGIVAVLGFGLLSRSGWKSLIDFPIRPVQLILFVSLLLISLQIGRGMPIHDDYAHLPTTSMMAAGYIPPVFSLDPAVPYGYHYFLMLFAAQIVRIGHLYVWIALDAARALSFSLAIFLSAFFAWRVTGNRLAGLFGAAMMAFGAGTRWLFLLFPSVFVQWVSSQVQLVGSGRASGETFAGALFNPWASTSGPVPFPFAFVNGIIYPGTLSLFGIAGLMSACVGLTLLLTFNRWKNAWAGVVSVILIASTGLLYEAEVALFMLAWILIGLIWRVTHRHTTFPPALKKWLWVASAGTALSLVQGGAWTDLLVGWSQRLFLHTAPASFQTIEFAFAWPPSIVSQSLGVLSLFNFRQLLVAIAELGPLLLVLPLLVVWGFKAYRAGRWLEAAIILSGLMSTGMVFVHFAGVTGVENTARLFSFMELSKWYAVPIAWIVLRRWRELAVSLGFITMLAGIMILGVDLYAIQRPVASDFLNQLDARVMRKYWNRLPEDSMVFDLNPNRSVTVFGRPVNSSLTWYAQKPEWQALSADPTTSNLIDAGYLYLYVDPRTWDELPANARADLEKPCVRLLDEEMEGNDFRRLLDLSECRLSAERP